MPSRVPPSSTHTRCRNPASVCSSSTGSASSSFRYQAPLTSMSWTVRATWARPGKSGMVQLLLYWTDGLDDSSAAFSARSHVPQVHLIAEHPELVRDHPVGQSQTGQQPLEAPLLCARPRQLHVGTELVAEEPGGREEVQRTSDHTQGPG